MIKFNPRLYQESISSSCQTANSLIVLPTGMGKTKTAILVASKRLESYPNSKVLFLTPTKPLASQIGKEFKSSTDIQEVEVFTGEISPEKRKELTESAKIIVSTPQAIENDIIRGSIKLDGFSLLVIDEAHRAIKDYSYTWLAKHYNKTSKYPRIIGLTASPGSDLNKIQEICKNLFIENIETRDENDPDVKPYVQEVKREWVFVDLPENYREILNLLKSTYEQRLIELKNKGVINSLSPTKKELLELQGRLHGDIIKGNKSFEVFKAISLCAEVIKINYVTELLETQGPLQCYEYVEELYKTAEKTKVKATKNIVADPNFKSAYLKLKNLIETKQRHPKQEKIMEILRYELDRNPNLKTIIFTNFRSSAIMLEKDLSKIQGISTKIFVGQTKKRNTGLSQKQQILLIQEFESGKHNCLISTSIGEEGLDIPDVDLVIFYEPVPSAIRSIQRKGRTARHSEGKVIILVTKNTRDEISHWSSHNKEKSMKKILKSLKEKILIKKQPTLNDFSEEVVDNNILADSREKGSNILKELKDLGLNIGLQNLNVGDYVISDRIGIERKTKIDFVNSIIDKRLIPQIRSLRNSFERPLLIIEGEEDIYSLRKIHPNAINGILSTIVIDYSVPILFTKNYKETAQMIKTISSREERDDVKEVGLRLEKKPLTTKELQEYIIESLPGVGPSISKSLLAQFGSIQNIFNSSEEELSKIDNLGEKKAKEISRIIKEKYLPD